MQLKHAIIGGTFDHFHIGHQALLNEAFKRADKVSLGISKPELYQHKLLSQTIEDYATRERSIINYLKQNNLIDRAMLVPITDMYGTTLIDPTIDAVVVSPDTEENAKIINDQRKSEGLPLMEIITVPYVLGDDRESVSSERIRSGEIDREGHSYFMFFQSRDGYKLPDNLRDELKKPVGTVVSETNKLSDLIQNPISLITVGDIATATLLETDIHPDIAIIDLRTQRHPLEEQVKERFLQFPISLSNPAGTINPEIGNILRSFFSERASVGNESKSQPSTSSGQTTILRVEGEEDLLALPAMLLSPLGAVMIYGQYNLGMVVVKITEDKKEYAKHLLEQF